MDSKVQLNHSVFQEEIVSYKYILNIGDFGHEQGELDEIMTVLQSANENDILEININSRGGDSDELCRFTNIVHDNFYGRVTTRLNPNGYSAGAFLFLQGDIRLVYENSCAMFHDASFGISGKHSDIKSRTKFNEKYLNDFLTNTLEPYFNDEEIDAMLNGKEMWLDAFELCKRKIATHISIYNKIVSADEYTNAMKSDKTQLEFYQAFLNDDTLSEKDKMRIERKIERIKQKKDAK